MDAEVTPGQVVGENVRKWRPVRGWTQAALAARLHRLGLNWGPDQVVALESRDPVRRRADLTITEALVLAEAFEVPVAQLFEGEGDVDLQSGNLSMSLEDVRRLLSGEPSEGATDELPPSDLEKGWSKQLGATTAELRVASSDLWGRTVDEELKRLLADDPRPFGVASAAISHELFVRLQQALGTHPAHDETNARDA